MTDAVERKLRIADIMILIAATAVALAAVRFIWSGGGSAPSVLGLPLTPWGWGAAAVILSAWGVMIAMLALIPLGLRQPRPTLDLLCRQPGWLACSAVALTLVLSTLIHIPMIAIAIAGQRQGMTSGQLAMISVRALLFQLPDQAVFAIAGAWMTLALVGAWRPNRRWIDRWGFRFAIYLLLYPLLFWIMAIL
jgi:hypothetical protein